MGQEKCNYPHRTAKSVLKRLLIPGAIISSLVVGAVCVADYKKPEAAVGSKVSALKPAVVDPGADVVSIAAIRKLNDGKTVAVLFNEKAQIFTIQTSERSGGELVSNIQKAFKNNQPLKVTFGSGHAAIKAVAAPSPKEMESYRSIRKEILKSEKPLTIDLNKIDTSKFDNIENLKFPVWKLCVKTVPNYTKAKEIFDYCAKQSCNLPGPYNVSPCIPFQYVRDGCYARAHKMKWIISEHFGYCSEKVFSFANLNNDELSVVASKWGGCCVTWWYHVAPVIRVNTKIVLNGKTLNLVMAYVIDPGMFDKPVLLSTWLGAQANSACSAHAKVSTYTIQPASAYSPANYQGTAFTTDPLYTATNATLNSYKNLVTCN